MKVHVILKDSSQAFDTLDGSDVAKLAHRLGVTVQPEQCQARLNKYGILTGEVDESTFQSLASNPEVESVEVEQEKHAI